MITFKNPKEIKEIDCSHLVPPKKIKPIFFIKEKVIDLIEKEETPASGGSTQLFIVDEDCIIDINNVFQGNDKLVQVEIKRR